MMLLLDMNISPKLVDLLLHQGLEVKHWYGIGKPDATDTEIMAYAKDNDCIVVTYDLDFSAILAITQSKKPSVIQIRKQGLQLSSLAELLANTTRHWEAELERGAILSLDARREKIRLLPLANMQ